MTLILNLMFRILYKFFASLTRLAVRSGRSKDIEIIVLRHQLNAIRRQSGPTQLNNEDRALLGAIASALPCRLRNSWIVTPDTLLRWHRRRIGRHWTQPSRRPGRPSTTAEVRRLIIDMATHNLLNQAPSGPHRIASTYRDHETHRSSRLI